MKYSVFLLIISFLVLSCSKQVTDIYATFSANKLFYGDTTNLTFYSVFKDSSESQLRYRDLDNLEVTVKNGTYENGKVIALNYPQKKEVQSLQVHLRYQTDSVFIEKDYKIPYHFEGNLSLNFSGEDGEDQKGRMGRVFGDVISRDGREGKDGYEGEPGTNGKDVVAYIWRGDQDHIQIKLTRMDNGAEYFYQLASFEFIEIVSNGGNGGRGGDAGPGGDGDDGEVKDGKRKPPGDGGNGGVGGQGGAGGNGGNVIVYLHPNAKSIQSKIRIRNFGGTGGIGGEGGDGGTPGDPLEGQKEMSSGSQGAKGINGVDGQSGEISKIEIKTFEIK